MNKLSINDTEFTELVFNFAFPVGSFYVQFPVKDKNINEYSSIDEIAFPDEERPERLFGGSWQEQWPKESIFFRTPLSKYLIEVLGSGQLCVLQACVSVNSGHSLPSSLGGVIILLGKTFT
jgi:hypothetical protein